MYKQALAVMGQVGTAPPAAVDVAVGTAWLGFDASACASQAAWTQCALYLLGSSLLLGDVT